MDSDLCSSSDRYRLLGLPSFTKGLLLSSCLSGGSTSITCIAGPLLPNGLAGGGDRGCSLAPSSLIGLSALGSADCPALLGVPTVPAVAVRVRVRFAAGLSGSVCSGSVDTVPDRGLSLDLRIEGDRMPGMGKVIGPSFTLRERGRTPFPEPTNEPGRLPVERRG